MNGGAARSTENFWSGFVHACLPLAIWAGHFFASYVFVAVGCHAGLDARTAFGVPVLTLALMAATLLAMAALSLLLLRPTRSRSAGGGDAVAAAFRRGAAALSLVAVGWIGVPVALLRSCLQ